MLWSSEGKGWLAAKESISVTTTCPKCGATMEEGFTTATGLLGGGKLEGEKAQLVFVVVGVPTSLNPISAFKQGASDEAANRPFRVSGVRCSQCGFLELYGNDELFM